MRILTAVFVLPFAWVAASSAAPPFPDLVPGYTQELYAVYPDGLLSIAFAPDGDVLSIVDHGFAGGSVALVRFDAQSTTVTHGQIVHPPVGTLPSPNASVGGIVSHPDGSLYLSSFYGPVHIDGTTGAVLAGPVSSSHAFQIAVDPTNSSRLVGANYGGLVEIDAVTLAGTPYPLWNPSQVALVDVAIEASGSPYVGAYDQYAGFPGPDAYRIELLNPISQALGVSATLPDVPHQIALFDGLANIIAQLSDGRLMRADLSSEAPGTIPATPFATSDFPGRGVRVGPEGCLYVVQRGTRFEDGGVTNESSIVRVCPEAVRTEATTWGKLKAAYR